MNKAINTQPQVTASASQTDPTAPADVDLLGDSPVCTPEIQRLASAVCSHFRLGFRGMAVDGQQRCGKTSACEFLVDTLADVIGYPVMTFLWSIPEFAKTERDFIQERLRDSGCYAVTHRDAAVLRSRLYDHIAESAAQVGGRQVVIIVDEAHYLTREQYYYLLHCDNNLRTRRLKPFFVLVGQPELRSTPSSWMRSNGFQVVGRFFSRLHTYRGIALDDVAEVIQGFDEPDGDSKSATYAVALPEAYAAGWRLSQVSLLLIEAIRTVANKQNITSGVRVPMENLRAMLLSVLFQLIDSRMPPGNFNGKMALRAVQDSAFPTVMNYYVDQEAIDEAA